MATDVILPALGMSQDTGKIVQWLKGEGEQVAKGEPLVEIETDKATVEIEAPVAGVLTRVSGAEGEDVPVGQVIARILVVSEHATGLQRSEKPDTHNSDKAGSQPSVVVASPRPLEVPVPTTNADARPAVAASMLASRIAADHNLDLSLVKASGKRIQKSDVLTYLQSKEAVPASASTQTSQMVLASPKARRLAAQDGKDLQSMKGSGPGGAVLAADVLAATVQTSPSLAETTHLIAPAEQPEQSIFSSNGTNDLTPGNIWRIMAERTTQSWTQTPHFYLMREVNVSRLVTWREEIMKHSATKITYTDLLVKIVAAALRANPRVNASWSNGKITLKPEINIGLAVAIEDGLVVPVIHHADGLGLAEIAQRRVELVAKAQAGKLRPQDIGEGTFTISNLGMYNVDAFNAIINQPQAAILAVGRIAERVVAVHGQPAVQPIMVLTLSCDHRVVDGARGARFLESIASFLEEPLGLLM